MMVFRVSRLAPVALVAVALGFAGCNGEDDDDTGATVTPPTTVGPDTDTDPTGETDTVDPDDTGDDDDTATPDVAFSEVEPIFQSRCVDGCHEPGGLWASYDMTDIHDSMVGVSGPSQGTQCFLIEPGDPDRSYIWHKINGTHLQNCNGGGAQMPVTPENTSQPDPLSASEIELIEGWILAGAPS